MDKQFTASEVRDWERAYKGTGAAKVFGAFADLLEAREKAVPVVVVNHVSSAEHDLPIGMKLYTHPAPADAERLAEALRNARGFVLHFGDEPARVCIAEIDAALAAHSAQAQPADNELPGMWSHSDFVGGDPDERSYAERQAQPPASSVTDAMVIFEVVSGIEGPCLTISREADGKPRHEYRLAGPKPWGGGNTTHSFKVHTRELREQIDAIEAALAAQENPNG